MIVMQMSALVKHHTLLLLAVMEALTITVLVAKKRTLTPQDYGVIIQVALHVNQDLISEVGVELYMDHLVQTLGHVIMGARLTVEECARM